MGRERLPDHVRRAAVARRAAGRSDRPPDDPPLRPGRLRHRLGALRPLAERVDADRRAAPPGHRRRDDLGRCPGHDRDDVPGASGSGQGGGGLRLRRLGGRRGRPADRWCRDPDDQLALDLLHQCPDRALHGDLRTPPAREGRGDRLRPGRGHARGRPDHRLADARRLHDRRAGRQGRLGRPPDPGARRRLSDPARAVRGARGEHDESPDPAADLPLTERHGREPRPGADGRGDVRRVLHGLALPAAGPGLRRTPDRPGLPAGDDHHGHAHGPLLRAADHALRRAAAALPRPRPGGRRSGATSRAPRSTATTSSTSCRSSSCSAPAWGSASRR